MQISANFFVHIHDHLFRIRTENVGATVPDERGTHLTDIKVHAYITDLDTSKSMYSIFPGFIETFSCNIKEAT